MEAVFMCRFGNRPVNDIYPETLAKLQKKKSLKKLVQKLKLWKKKQTIFKNGCFSS